MATSCTRIALLAIALLVGTSTTGLAHPSDWADIVETKPAKSASSAPKAKKTVAAKKVKKAKKAKAKAKAKKTKAKRRR